MKNFKASPVVSTTNIIRLAEENSLQKLYKGVQKETSIEVILSLYNDGNIRIVATNEFGRCIFRGDTRPPVTKIPAKIVKTIQPKLFPTQSPDGHYANWIPK